MTLNPAHTSSSRQDYETPPPVFRFIERFLGVCFVVDFAASDSNALCPLYYTAERSAFNTPWVVPPVLPNAAGWCNPPYGDPDHPVRDWVKRPLPGYNYVFLLPCNKMDQPWVWDLRDRAMWVTVTGRVQYTLNSGARPTYVNDQGREVVSSNSQGSTLLCLGPRFVPETVKYINLKEIKACQYCQGI